MRRLELCDLVDLSSCTRLNECPEPGIPSLTIGLSGYRIPIRGPIVQQILQIRMRFRHAPLDRVNGSRGGVKPLWSCACELRFCSAATSSYRRVCTCTWTTQAGTSVTSTVGIDLFFVLRRPCRCRCWPARLPSDPHSHTRSRRTGAAARGNDHAQQTHRRNRT